jgi:hypothetical protein
LSHLTAAKRPNDAEGSDAAGGLRTDAGGAS